MIISVINLKGGSGKTTTAMALATAAARHNRNVSPPHGRATPKTPAKPCRSPWTPPISAN